MKNYIFKSNFHTKYFRDGLPSLLTSSSLILLGQHHELMAWSVVDWLHLLPSLRLKTLGLVRSMIMYSAVQWSAGIYSG